ncbi:M1 family metallopeptidase [bacterium SCSIO 12741]|nr:M1 family metallopeptidase [bacterium SCSIO 12741]
MKKSFLFLGGLFALFSCTSPTDNSDQTDVSDNTTDSTMIRFDDVHSFSKPEEAKITHLQWTAEVNFDQEIISGVAQYKVDLAPNASEIILDTKNDMKVLKTWLNENEEVEFTLKEAQPFLGRALHIPVKAGTQTVSIQYETSPDAEALQWLNAQQTADKKAPFLFTQSQAILARSWIPIQDGPGIRFTYSADVTVPNNLLALMSAENPREKSANGKYHFEMKQPVPAYLMALTVGDFEYRQIGPHTGIYAENSILEKAAWEFAEMEDMLVAAEELYGKYQWEIYDMIVLPPSFPFGGMENPRLTFATPTILAGDRSLTALVAHELAHSWSGNLVTNATWDDFWLNEGFTVYFERRIMEALYGEAYAEMLAELGYQDLQHTVETFIKEENKPEDTHLKLNLKGRNPDDGMSDIAYEKGYFLLRLIEKSVGREKWDTFLKNYFQENAFQVMTTEVFLDHLKKNLLGEEFYEELKIDAWVYAPGIPANCPAPESDKFEKVEAQIAAWQNGSKAAELDTANWSSHEWLHFIRNLPTGLSYFQMKELDEAFGFTQSGNSEVLAAWFQHTIRNDYKDADDRMKAFLIEVGRRKFLTPTYKALVESNKLEQARSIYQEARPNYHSVSTATMDALLMDKAE